MFKKILGKFSFISEKDKVIFPLMSKPHPKKEIKIEIFAVENKKDFTDLRRKIESVPILFVNIKALVGEELRIFVERLKNATDSNHKHLTGLDKSWLVVSENKIEKN